MIVRYEYIDDSREREGDWAREGFFYQFWFQTDDEAELEVIKEWIAGTLVHSYMQFRGSFTDKNNSRMYSLHFVMKDLNEATLTRLRWC